jgi:hypothetical protein
MKTKGKYANPQRERIDPLWVKQTQLIAATFLHNCKACTVKAIFAALTVPLKVILVIFQIFIAKK